MKHTITRDRVLEFARSLPAAGTDCPFEEDFETTVLRHTDTGKWFGVLLQAPCCKVGLNGDGTAEVLNLKCDPLWSDVLFQNYRGIVPAYHMNKHHWISVVLTSDVPWEELEQCICMSYELTAKKSRKRQ